MAEGNTEATRSSTTAVLDRTATTVVGTAGGRDVVQRFDVTQKLGPVGRTP